MSAEPALPASEDALVSAWFEAPRTGLRLEDGRLLRVVFPGVPGPGHGPDVRDAILDAGGDYLKGDIEFHLATSGWRAHGHHRDPAFARVVLHVAAANDTGELRTPHGVGRDVPVLVFRPPRAPHPSPPPFTPPCAFEAARGRDIETPLAALSRRRLRAKAARLQARLATETPAQALYATLLETLGGPANRDAFAAAAAALPLPALLEHREAAPGGGGTLALAAALRPVLNDQPLASAGLRPAARPARRLESAAALVDALWPVGSSAAWPAALAPGTKLPGPLKVQGIGRPMAIELAVNAVLPTSFASGEWDAPAVDAAWAALPSPGTYGRLRPLEHWLGQSGAKPFTSAARLQAGLLLHNDYCSRGACGRCPLSD